MAKIRGAADSCDGCSQQKVECDKTRPACEVCTSRGEACNYPQSKRRKSDIWNARTDSRYYNAVPDKDGFYHCGIKPCNHKAIKNISKHFENLDSHIKPYRCNLGSCRNKEFGSRKQHKDHTRKYHNPEPTRRDIKDSPLPSNSSSVPDAMSLNNTNTPITEKSEEVDSSGGGLSEDIHFVSLDEQFHKGQHQSEILGSGQGEVLHNSQLNKGTATYAVYMVRLHSQLQSCRDPSSKDNIDNLRRASKIIQDMAIISHKVQLLSTHLATIRKDT